MPTRVFRAASSPTDRVPWITVGTFCSNGRLALRAIARRQGFGDLGEVSTAILETNGVVSMFRQDEGGRYHPDIAPGGLRIGKHRGQSATG